MERYLTPADYSIQIRKEIKDFIGGTDDKKLVIAETAAVNQMKSYLKKRYDLTQIFYLLKGEHDAEVDYKKGDLVYYKESEQAAEDYKVYEAKEDTLASAWDEEDWSLFTKRNPFIMLYLVDITLYHLHSKDATRLIPQIRNDRYVDALDWMKLVGNGEIDADLPQQSEKDETGAENPDYKPDIRYNSHPSENHRW